jgi:hypothetical protein
MYIQNQFFHDAYSQSNALIMDSAGEAFLRLLFDPKLTLYLTTLFFLRLARWWRLQTAVAQQMPTVIKTNDTVLMKGK